MEADQVEEAEKLTQSRILKDAEGDSFKGFKKEANVVVFQNHRQW